MAGIVLICAGFLGFSPPNWSEHQAASTKAGRDAGTHLKLAVWCNAHGMEAERLKHLESALLIDPHNAALRGMMGLVAYGGAMVATRTGGRGRESHLALTAKLARYEDKRKVTLETAEA